jgi:ribonuclease E
MRTFVVAAAAALVGLVGAVAGYQHAIDEPTTTPAAAQAPAAAPAKTPVKVRFARCARGFERHGKACVRTVERVVVVDVPAKPAPVAAPSSSGRGDGARDDHGARGDGPTAHGTGSAGAGDGDDRDEARDDDHGDEPEDEPEEEPEGPEEPEDH